MLYIINKIQFKNGIQPCFNFLVDFFKFWHRKYHKILYPVEKWTIKDWTIENMCSFQNVPDSTQGDFLSSWLPPFPSKLDKKFPFYGTQLGSSHKLVKYLIFEIF